MVIAERNNCSIVSPLHSLLKPVNMTTDMELKLQHKFEQSQ